MVKLVTNKYHRVTMYFITQVMEEPTHSILQQSANHNKANALINHKSKLISEVQMLLSYNNKLCNLKNLSL